MIQNPLHENFNLPETVNAECDDVSPCSQRFTQLITTQDFFCYDISCVSFVQ